MDDPIRPKGGVGRAHGDGVHAGAVCGFDPGRRIFDHDTLVVPLL